MYVYFIQSGNGKSAPVKIGLAKDIEKRISDLQVGNPQPLKLIASIPCRSRKHAEHLEGWLHRCFSNCHMRGEWFRGGKINIKQALNRFDTDTEFTREKHRSIHGSKAEQKIRKLKEQNVNLHKALSIQYDAIDEELDRATLLHLPEL